jgi:hypothetical protein
MLRPHAEELNAGLAGINKSGDEYEQEAAAREETEEMRSDPISSPVAPVPPIQRKPTISSPDDPSEREADDVADAVMRVAEPAPIGSAPTALQRKCAQCIDEEKTIQTKHAPSANAEAELDAGAAVRAAERGGAPLPGEVRSYFEPRFAHDFSAVRVHADGPAADGARAVQARAYTIGHNIVFGSGEYAPGTVEGKRLLAHELVHVVQQGAGAFATSAPADPAGRETEGKAAAVSHAAQGPLFVRQRTPSAILHRQHVHMASGRFAGDLPGPDNNQREEVLDVIDRLASMKCISQPDYSVEYPAVKALPAASSVPVATIPKTIDAIRTAEDPVLDVYTAQHSLALNLTNAVGRAQPNVKPDILAIQDQLHTDWHLVNPAYTAERGVVNALPSAVPDTAIPMTIEGIGKQKVAIVAGQTGSAYRHQLAASLTMERLVGQQATWVGSGPGSKNTFETWASAADEAAAGPLPAVVAATRINCWEMVLVAALQAKLIDWNWVHKLYTTSLGAGWDAHLVATLTRGTRTPYHPADPNTPRPNRGQVVFFDGSNHVALANGVVDGTGRAQVWTFWPPPGTAFVKGGTLDQVKLSTIEELSSWMAANFRAAPVVELSVPPW